MSLLIRSCRITDPGSPHNGKVKDILIENGRITRIAGKISAPGIRSFDASGKYASPGWFDLYAYFRDPGYEYKEDILSGCRAAAAGGFTGVVCMPDTLPAIQSKSEVEYVLKKSAGNVVDLYPAGAVTKDRKGRELTEMYDMQSSGAVAFTDAAQPIADAGVMMRALLYVKPLGSTVMNCPYDPALATDGSMHEGAVSTALGLKGIPSLAEESMVARDIALAEYTGSRLHFTAVSTARSVEMIRQARRKGIRVTASVPAYQLVMDDSMLKEYDTNAKVMPPLRSRKDIAALRKGLSDGTIDAICSNHSPQDEEAKKVEFNYASFGMTALETVFPLALLALRGTLRLPQIIDRLAVRPRKVLGLQVPAIKENEKANLTVFDPAESWTYTEKQSCSRSGNSPLFGQKLKGRALAVYNNGKMVVNE